MRVARTVATFTPFHAALLPRWLQLVQHPVQVGGRLSGDVRLGGDDKRTPRQDQRLDLMLFGILREEWQGGELRKSLPWEAMAQ
jgi:hypothetical protein